jgi:nitroreductase
MSEILDVIQARHSSRGPFDPNHPVSAASQRLILEAARWAPTPANMQNFEIIVVDSRERIDALEKIPAEMSEKFLRENYQQLSFSEQDLHAKKTGMLATDFPEAWTNPEAWDPYSDTRSQLSFLARPIGETPLMLIVLYDSTKRAPGSDGDPVGLISLGCVMENMWLMCESLGVGVHVITVVSNGPVEALMRDVLHIPKEMNVAFACCLGYTVDATPDYSRVRRDLDSFVHHDDFGQRLAD